MVFWTPTPIAECDNRFAFKVVPDLCFGAEGGRTLYGGAIMAAAIEALETVCGKPLAWATIQFLRPGYASDMIEIEVNGLEQGRNIAQAVAHLRVGDALLQRTVAALGTRPGFEALTFKSMPQVPAPQDSEPRSLEATVGASLVASSFERRVAHTCPEDGTQCLWVRPSADLPRNAALYAFISDFILGAHPMSRGGTSLDNTLRIHQSRESEWILCVTEHSGFANGFVHGVQHQFSQDGTLLCQSSQTGTLPRHIAN